MIKILGSCLFLPSAPAKRQRQTDRQTGRQAGRQADMQTEPRMLKMFPRLNEPFNTGVTGAADITTKCHESLGSQMVALENWLSDKLELGAPKACQ